MPSLRPFAGATGVLLLASIGGGRVLEAQAPPRAERGAPLVTVSETGGVWTIAGRRQVVTLRASDLALEVKAGPATWTMPAPDVEDLLLKADGEEFAVRLKDAGRRAIAAYDTGFKTGVKLALGQWKRPGAGAPVELPVFLTVALEGDDEDVVFTVAADEGRGAVVRRLDWPAALDAGDVDHTVLNHYRGILLPRDWPKPYHPIRGDDDYPNDSSEVQSDVVECWSQSFWGFQKGPSAAMVIVETSDDAAYRWSHPKGGPTVVGPRWRAQLGRLGYPRSARMVFFEKGDYVDMAKRYRRYAKETGLWVPLTAKIARTPAVGSLVGSVESRIGILRNIVPESRLYDKERPERNYRLTTFDERAAELRGLKAKGIDKFQVVLTGWPRLGYDREHPDGLPPAPAAGGFEAMKRLAETCRKLGYVFTLHDQYRDYYVEAPSYDPQFAVHEEDAASPPSIFPGTRFGSWKEGPLSFLAAWDGGKQTYLGPRFMLGHLKKNYAGLFEHGIRPDGSYLDVFGYVPPDQDFNPQHPTTRTQAKREIARLYLWARENLGIVGTEAGVDWTVPYTDYSSPLGPGKAGIPVPLFGLVYHDAVMTPFSPGGGEARMNRDDRPNWLYGMLNGGPPRVNLQAIDEVREVLRKMTTLHERVALLEMTDHEFLAPDHSRERTTFADGTTVTVDWNAKTVEVSPEPK